MLLAALEQIKGLGKGKKYACKRFAEGTRCACKTTLLWVCPGPTAHGPEYLGQGYIALI